MATLRELVNTRWIGRSELWLDPLGNTADTSDCAITIAAGAIDYHWFYEGKQHTGKIALRDGGAEFTDTFHAATPLSFTAISGSWALVDVQGTYSGGEGPPWGWRIIVSLRPHSDELVLQMTNITPWGEDGRAVRMVCNRA